MSQIVGHSAGVAQPLSASSPFLQRDRIRPGVDYVAPAGDSERRLAAIWQEVLQIDRIGAMDDFFALGGDSMQAAALFQRLEAEFGLKLAPSTILEHPTVARLAPLFSGASPATAGSCLATLQAEGEGPPLFFVHAGGGNVICYRPLVKRLGPGRRMYGFVYPDQDQDPLPRHSFSELAARYVAAARRVQPDGPYFLIGYSLGGHIAYEMARQLRAEGARIALLVLIDSPTSDGLTRGLTRVARKLSGHLATLSERPLATWPSYFSDALVKDAKRRVAKLAPAKTRPAPPADAPRQMILKHRVEAALKAALDSYMPTDYDGAVKLFRCIDGPSARWTLRHQGWEGRARGGVEIFDLPAIHYDAIKEPVAALIAAQIQTWLENARA